MKRFFLILIMLIGVFAMHPAYSATAKITLHPEAQVHPASQITLGEVATITASKALSEKIGGIAIATAPLAGGKKTVASSYIKSKVNAANPGHKITITGSDEITLVGKSIHWQSQEIADKAKSYLESLLPQDNLEYEITITREPRDITTVKDSSAELRPRFLNNQVRTGYNTVAMDAVVNGRTVATTNVTFQIKAVADVLVATYPIKQGEAITSANTCWEKRDISRTGSPITMPYDGTMQQWVARRSIMIGNTINASDVTLPPAVRKGDTVTLLVTYGNVKLSTTAEAKRDGKIGDSITVKTTISAQEIHARVVEPGLVEIR